MATDEIISLAFLSIIILSCIALSYFAIRTLRRIKWQRAYEKATFLERRNQLISSIKKIDKKQALGIMLAVVAVGVIIPLLLSRRNKK